ncbi:L-lactate 2-monooxygenase [Halolactibacillus miurensis]|uniref:L-lactate oxidase n=1 Tax=Halolactibacillus miurensis TaxID=306541 RepID=A0A1I6PAF5_9BACI|nr:MULTISPECIES: alpha-hydroxy acid oxidase [Halolactibacillus]GEM03018.1 L-lactate 2-monooxygenase [Halolactibacillus miurensis]SFS37151.1 FMN-dependent dehydrogenase, includes L-lactate dehydrogenase and type II isopentenyl diphosphate isomerase [Halolactibacillus miurensis]
MTLKTTDKWETIAKQQLSRNAFGYLSGGAGSEVSLKYNAEQFNRYRLIPRLLRDVSHVDTSVELLHSTIQAPILLAPIGFHTIVHECGERASASAANTLGLPFIQSTVASFSIEDISEVMTESDHYFQLYWPSDDDVAYSLVRRAEQAGVKGLVITVDTPVLGRREIDLSHDYFPMDEGAGMANFMTDPVFKEKYVTSEDNQATLKQKIQSILFNQTLTFEKVETLISQTSLPVIIKGILEPSDAKHCKDIGAAGVIVSNHGARQLDSAIEPLEVIEEIREKVGHDFPLLIDGGIRRGTDVIKAYMLGADSVLIGRPYIYGLTGGEVGVRDVLEQLIDDLTVNLKLLGAASWHELSPAQIRRL